jgi:S-DNA-T family DNA segregation ATPase FtsK/SpoIIIE
MDFEDMDGVKYMGNAGQLESFYKALLAEKEAREEDYQDSGLRPREFCASRTTIPIFIDDAENFIEMCKDKTIEIVNLLEGIEQLGFAIVSTTIPTKLKNFDSLTKILRAAQSGVVLGVPGDQTFITIPTIRGYKAIPDIGFWFKRGDVKKVKIPMV